MRFIKRLLSTNLQGMGKPKIKRLRWDRIGAVSAILILGSWGIGAVIPDSGTNASIESEGRVSMIQAQPSESAFEEGQTAQEDQLAAQAEPVVIAEAESVAQPAEDAVVVVPSGPLPRRGIAPCSCSKHTMSLARNPYTQHQQRARTLPGSFFVKNKTVMNAGADRGALKEVPLVGRGYHLHGLSHSEPYLLPAAKAVLLDMANRFADAMEGTADEGASIRITSLTRTEAQQNRLRRRNANAFKGKSSHSYGASFDVAFIDRPDNSVTCGGPTWAMQTILQDMQREGKILIIPEGICMHITPR